MSETAVTTTNTNKTTLIQTLAQQNLMNQDTFWNVLRSSVVPREFSNEQTMVFLAVAHQLGLSPIHNEIHPMLHKGRVLPLVGIDGWVRRMNSHPQFDGIECTVSEDGTSATCSIYRKDRSRPIVVTEYLSECKKSTGPWDSHPKRMLRHRAIIQCIRLAFGSGGAVDEDDRHYFETEATVVTDSEDTGNRARALSETLKQKVKEEEPTFKTVEGMTCTVEGCRKRLIQPCKECGDAFCADHWSHDRGMCLSCADELEALLAAQVGSDELDESVENGSGEADPPSGHDTTPDTPAGQDGGQGTPQQPENERTVDEIDALIDDEPENKLPETPIQGDEGELPW